MKKKWMNGKEKLGEKILHYADNKRMVFLKRRTVAEREYKGRGNLVRIGTLFKWAYFIDFIELN